MKAARNYEILEYTTDPSPKMPEPKLSKKKTSLQRIEKYSLRQRQKRKAILDPIEDYDGDNGSGSGQEDAQSTRALHSTPKQQKLSSNNRSNKDKSATSTPSSSASSPAHSASAKAKPKAAPLSKYRRKTANARERSRMREINSAFENLRHCVPSVISGEDTAITNEKLTKITTLRLAMKYITLLNEALVNPDFKVDFLLECERAGDERFTNPEGQTKITKPPALNELPSANKTARSVDKLAKKPTKTKGTTKSTSTTKSTATQNSRKGVTKRQTKKQKLQQPDEDATALCTVPSVSPVSTTGSSTCSSSSSTSAYASLLSANCSSETGSPHSSRNSSSNSSFSSSSSCSLSQRVSNYNCIDTHPLSDLTSLMLESDGESLHLSEHCVSPMQNAGPQSLLGTDTPTTSRYLSRFNAPQKDHLTLLDNPFELNLNLLESSSDDSFDFAATQPSSCLSPLTVYSDAFNSFGDLLQPDFSDHAPMDLFST